MKITTYVDLTPAQEHTLEDMQRVEVRTALISPFVVATFKTFQDQQVKITLDINGVINHVELIDTP